MDLIRKMNMKPRIIEPRYSHDFTTEDTREFELTYTAKVRIRISANGSLCDIENKQIKDFLTETFSQSIESSVLHFEIQDKLCDADVTVLNSIA